MVQQKALTRQTHAAFNSASRTRSARAAIAELNQTGLGSPPRRTRGQTVEILSPRKPEVRETAAPFRFGGLQNGFAASSQLRQTIQSRRPATSPKTGTRNHEVQSTPASPRKDEHHETLGQDDAAGWDDHSQVRMPQITSWLISQLVYHVFNYRGTARATEDRWTESLLNRLLRYQPDSMSTQYTSASARLLQAASDMKASVYHAAGEILESLSGFFSVIARSVMVNRQPDKSTVNCSSHTRLTHSDIQDRSDDQCTRPDIEHSLLFPDLLRRHMSGANQRPQKACTAFLYRQ